MGRKRKIANKKTKTEKRTQGKISISKIDCRPEFVCNTDKSYWDVGDRTKRNYAFLLFADKLLC